ncbi:MAG: methylated-DNA--[protein]-cysteine S-methyltransferase [Candidatus Brocadiaceae bacterium]|nr:methylated-DNA--[protein]-cysteine S-methyltransferase [Candidatus Brocadiaceae bacterium]
MTKAQKGSQKIIYFSSFSTPIIGPVYIAKSERGICRIAFSCKAEGDFISLLRKDKYLKIRRNDTLLAHEISLLQEYFNGNQVVFDFPLDLDQGTPFQKKVWSKLQEIPYGKCQSYKWVADQIGNYRAGRAVGLANKQNPVPPVVPCHRVIGSNGKLTGYASGLQTKKHLLEMESKGYHT